MGLLHDRTGRFSPLLTLTLVGLCLPAAWLAFRAAHGDFSGAAPAGPPGLPPGFADGPGIGGPAAGSGSTPFGPAAAPRFGAPDGGPGGDSARPIYAAIHLTGDWAFRFLILSLMITPFRRLLHWPRLVLTRRRIGLAALAYGLGHLGLYALDQEFVVSKIASEIALRIYLAIGLVALLGLIALGATSWDGAVKRMGAQNWSRLHRLAYLIAGLATLHFFMQTKLDVSETLMWGLFLWAMGWRWLQRDGERAVSLAWLAGLAVAAALATALSEAIWYGLATGVDPLRVLKANFTTVLGLRPCWLVLIFGLVAAASSLIGARRRGAPRPRAAAQDRPSRKERMVPETGRFRFCKSLR
ncbi:sulfite oxidase heme-binding subunit YedZ [Chenggangzhangella methanolivorans]|uniref:Ferric reductase-like transmembrane domain-containing protein n=1 Tax=Chenggangzhangella methanolivorans TaxID=1437009 RepID=A0A9E6UIG5_9HYPH|nr:ferric reductase-like transmembrane domain-containing protein [Chenggangzhangella methanolivorans]QZO00843.1 ferric reductase-like transmembrane domain-containing protein [Chenggangzhangella methanolivorans]